MRFAISTTKSSTCTQPFSLPGRICSRSAITSYLKRTPTHFKVHSFRSYKTHLYHLQRRFSTPTTALMLTTFSAISVGRKVLRVASTLAMLSTTIRYPLPALAISCTNFANNNVYARARRYLEEYGNTGIPGEWMFQVDERRVIRCKVGVKGDTCDQRMRIAICIQHLEYTCRVRQQ